MHYLNTIAKNTMCLVISDRGPVLARVTGTYAYRQVGGHSHTKHQTAAVNTSVWAWGYQVGYRNYPAAQVRPI